MNPEIRYLLGDATAPKLEGPKIIVHICNDVGGWGRGFVLALSKRWPQPEDAYRAWYKSQNNFSLGEVQFVPVGHDIIVANLIGQAGLKPTPEGPPIRYQAVEKGLVQVALKAEELEAGIHMPRIGCGLAGGRWEEIEPIIHKTLLGKNHAVYVYDFSGVE